MNSPFDIKKHASLYLAPFVADGAKLPTVSFESDGCETFAQEICCQLLVGISFSAVRFSRGDDGRRRSGGRQLFL